MQGSLVSGAIGGSVVEIEIWAARGEIALYFNVLAAFWFMGAVAGVTWSWLWQWKSPVAMIGLLLAVSIGPAASAADESSCESPIQMIGHL